MTGTYVPLASREAETSDYETNGTIVLLHFPWFGHMLYRKPLRRAEVAVAKQISIYEIQRKANHHRIAVHDSSPVCFRWEARRVDWWSRPQLGASISPAKRYLQWKLKHWHRKLTFQVSKCHCLFHLRSSIGACPVVLKAEFNLRVNTFHYLRLQYEWVKRLLA